MYKNYYVLQKLSLYPQVVHAFSTRKAGDLEFAAGSVENGITRRKFVEQFAIPHHRVVKMEQPHGTAIAVVGAEYGQSIETSDAIEGVDGLLTNEERVYLFAKTADCLPIIYFDPKEGVVGLAHAGWRGVTGKLPALMVAEMMRSFGSLPENIMVGIGPCISKESNIVKGGAIQELLPEWEGFVERIDPEAVRVDLCGFAVKQLESVGVKEGNIEVGGVCTVQSPEDFYSASARQEKERMGTVVGLRSLIV
jgi:polyphenol oxidase